MPVHLTSGGARQLLPLLALTWLLAGCPGPKASSQTSSKTPDAGSVADAVLDDALAGDGGGSNAADAASDGSWSEDVKAVADAGGDAPIEGQDALAAAPLSIALTISVASTEPGGTVDVSWALAGDLQGLELVLQARRPGVVPSNKGNFGVVPGMPSATGATLYHQGSGAWTDAAAATAQPGAAASVLSPTLDATGQWRFTALLRKAASGAIVAMATRTLWVTKGPGMHLALDRVVGNSTEPFTATLSLAPGGAPVPVTVLAWLDNGDTRVALPGMVTEAMAPAFAGPIHDTSLVLLSRSLPPGKKQNKKWYTLEVRMLDAKGKVLRIAEAQLAVCDGQVQAAGTVVDHDGQPLGAGASVARVDFWDLARGAPIGSTPIAANGSFKAMLYPGRFWYAATVIDAKGGHRAWSKVLDLDDCGDGGEPGYAPNAQLQALAPAPQSGGGTAPPPPPPPAVPAPPPPPGSLSWVAQSDKLPKPIVKAGWIRLGNFAGNEIVDEILEETIGKLEAQEPDLLFVRDSQLRAAYDQIALLQMTGSAVDAETAMVIALLESVSWFQTDYILTLFAQAIGQKLARVAIVSFELQSTAVAVEFTVGPLSTLITPMIMTAIENFLATELRKPSTLFEKLRAYQPRPVAPVVRVTVAPQAIVSGGSGSFTATLTDYDGAPQAAKTLTTRLTKPGSPIVVQTCATDVNGQCTLNFTTNLLIGPFLSDTGHVQAEFVKPSGTVVKSEPATFLVLATTDVRVRPQRVSAPQGQWVTLELEYRLNGAPQANHPLTLSAPAGSFQHTTVTTNAQGLATASFKTPNFDGMVVIEAKSPLNGAKGTAPIYVDSSFAVSLVAEPNLLLLPGQAVLYGTTLFGGQGLEGLPVQITASHGLINTPLTSTDLLGSFSAVWLAPQSGNGTATITASVQVNNAQQVAKTTVFYTDPSQPPGQTVFAIGTFNGSSTHWFSCKQCPNQPDCAPGGAPLKWQDQASAVVVTPLTFVSDVLVKGKAEWTEGLEVRVFDVNIGPVGFEGKQTLENGNPNTNWKISAGVSASGQLTGMATQTYPGACVYISFGGSGPPPANWP